ncbi:MAG: flagellar hook capping FlgD N-terminal domain-containing protein [Campylobacterota bacterium]|nr:flagellar hook capping FlgD N-terminal domain-containing protein [Campylobacterota bacterium]
MAVENVVTNSAIGFDGNSYTTEVSNDKLTNEDFLRLMLEEMKMQDPTKPMDSAALMDSQLQMSSIEANMEMSASMKAMQASYASSALSTAANMIGHVVEDGSIGDDGILKSYKVETIENRDGELYVNARQLVGMTDVLQNSETEELVIYDSDGFLYDGDVKVEPNIRVALDNSGRFAFNNDGTVKLLDENSEVVTDAAVVEKYLFAGSSVRYADLQDVIPLNSIMQVR